MGSLVVSNITQYIFSWLDILKNCKVSCTFECKFVLWITIIHTQCDHVIYQSDQGHSLESERGAINNYIGTTGITGTVSNNLGLWDFLFIPCEWRRVFSHSMYTVPLRFLVLSFFLTSSLSTEPIASLLPGAWWKPSSHLSQQLYIELYEFALYSHTYIRPCTYRKQGRCIFIHPSTYLFISWWRLHNIKFTILIICKCI